MNGLNELLTAADELPDGKIGIESNSSLDLLAFGLVNDSGKRQEQKLPILESRVTYVGIPCPTNRINNSLQKVLQFLPIPISTVENVNTYLKYDSLDP